jgi:hypothetical protein
LFPFPRVIFGIANSKEREFITTKVEQSSHCMDRMTSRTYGVAGALIIVFVWSLLLGSDLSARWPNSRRHTVIRGELKAERA